MAIIAGNWKMNMTPSETKRFLEDLVPALKGAKHTIMVFPPFPCLQAAAAALEGSKVILGAQNLHHEEKGAFTGEVSAAMLADSGCDAVILGHSERRQHFKETNNAINLKIRRALRSGLQPVLCVGETDKQRESGETEEVLREQLNGCLKDLPKDEVKGIIIAYEPVWAIGTGKTATPDIAQETHAFIRSSLEKLFSKATAKAIPLLYGGSMKPDNAKALLSEPDIDGGLIGGASLDKEDFLAIIRAAD